MPECWWCNQDLVQSIGHSAASFHKVCNKCGHANGDRFEWKELRTELDGLRKIQMAAYQLVATEALDLAPAMDALSASLKEYEDAKEKE